MSMRYRHTGFIAVLVIVLALSFGVTGCKKQTSAAAGAVSKADSKRGGTMSFYIGSPAYIDPYNMVESEGVQVAQALFDSLTAFDPLDPAKVIPAAAESWEADSDGSVWTFKLRKEGRFSDGSPVTAQDFIYAWERIADPKTVNTQTGKTESSNIAYHLANVKGFDALQSGEATHLAGLKAVDDHTLQVTLSKPFGDFEYVVGHPALAPVSRKHVESGVAFGGAKVAYGDMPIGNGPFKMTEPWKHDRYIKVVRNDAYYGTKPLIDGIDFRILKDPATAYVEFEQGNLDFTAIAEGKVKAAAAAFGTSTDGYTAQPGEQVLLGAENSTYFLLCNLKNKALDNKNLRRALSLAINRQAICELKEGTAQPADDIVPPGMAGYSKGTWADSRYDFEAAKEALVEAGYPDGKGAPVLRLSFNAEGGHQSVMELVQSDLKAIGIDAQIDSHADNAAYMQAWSGGRLEIGKLEWAADYPIMDNFLGPLFSSGSDMNLSGYADAGVDSALLEARTITDGVERIKAYQEVDKTIQAENPIIPLTFSRHHHVTSKRVHGLTFSAMGLVDFTKVWLDKGAN